MIEVRVPDEQEGTKAVVRAWLKQVGDAVAKNDPLVELETDKVTQEVPSPEDGVLAEIILDTDAEAVPGALLARIEAGRIRSISVATSREPLLEASQDQGRGLSEKPVRMSPVARNTRNAPQPFGEARPSAARDRSIADPGDGP